MGCKSENYDSVLDFKIIASEQLVNMKKITELVRLLRRNRINDMCVYLSSSFLPSLLPYQEKAFILVHTVMETRKFKICRAGQRL